MNRVPIILACLAVSACALPTGKAVSQATLDSFVPGKTTCNEVRVALGTPQGGEVSYGDELWLGYGRTSANVLGIGSFENVTIRCDRKTGFYKSYDSTKYSSIPFK